MLHSSRQKATALWSAAVLALTVLALSSNASAQDTPFRTLAGISPAGNSDGTGTDARFNGPTAIAADGSGNLFVVDQQNCSIRKVTSAGVVTTLAGSPNCGALNGTGEAAQFNFPTGIAVDGAGNLYVADTNSHTIRKITAAGVVTTLAGLAFNSGTTDGTGSAARFNRPTAVAVDGAGIVYVADSSHTIRQVTPAGVVTTLAGTPGSSGYIEGPVASAKFANPRGIAVDAAGNLYVADSNNQAIRKIAAGMVTTLAGGAFGSQDGTGAAARFNGPRNVALDGAGNLYVADIGNQRIRQVTTAGGVVTTVSGSFRQGGNDGPAANARFNNPEGVAVDAAGAVYVADTSNDNIRKIASGVVTTLAGFVGSFGSADGEEQLARFGIPWGVALDSHGTLYVADRNNHTIRKVTRTGVVTTLAGLADNSGTADGTGSAARFGNPSGVAVDSVDNVYVFDTGNGMVRKITPDGVVTTLAGDGTFGNNDGTGSGARFSSQGGIAVDSATGLVYVADALNQKIRRITPAGVVTTIAGSQGVSGTADGAGTVARFNNPRALAVDGSGNVYIADTSNHTIRKMTPDGVVSTIAGVPGLAGGNDGPGTGTNPARFSSPQGIAVDNAGAVYVADTFNQSIRRIAANVVTRLAGCPGCFGGEDFGRFNQPIGMAVDARGFLYVGDSRNNTIRTTSPFGTSLVVDFGPPYGIWLRRGATWRQVHPSSAKAMVSIRDGKDDALIIDFGPGVGIWFYKKEGDGDEFWFQIHHLSADLMAGADLDGDGEVETGVFSFAGAGVWLFDGDNGIWSQLHGQNPSHLRAANLDGVGGDELIMDFPGYGLWISDGAGSWTNPHPFDVSTMTTADIDGNGKQDLIVNFPGLGVWAYMNRTAWILIHQFDAKRLASADLDGNGVPELIVEFNGLGLWVRRNATTWNQLHGASPDNIVNGDLDGDGHDELLADFGAQGIWSYQDGPGWSFVHAVNPAGMATGRLR